MPPEVKGGPRAGCLLQVCTRDPTTAPAGAGPALGASEPTRVVGEKLHFVQGVELLFGAAGHAEGGGAEPAILAVRVAGIHEEHVSGRQEAGGAASDDSRSSPGGRRGP